MSRRRPPTAASKAIGLFKVRIAGQNEAIDGQFSIEAQAPETLGRLTCGAKLLDDDVINEQHEIATTSYALPMVISVREAVWLRT
jgi:hypothetical protein